MSKKIAIIGGGGFAKEVIEVAEMLNYEIYGIFAKESNLDKINYCGYLDELNKLKHEFDGAVIAIGAINKKGIEIRAKIIKFLEENNIPLISIISPLSIISKSVKIGNGTYVAHSVTISCDTIIGNNILINHNVVIGHDCIINDNVSIAPQVFIGGNTRIDSDVIIGVAATIMQGISICSDVLIGMRSIVIKNIKSSGYTVPIPSKFFR